MKYFPNNFYCVAKPTFRYFSSIGLLVMLDKIFSSVVTAVRYAWGGLEALRVANATCSGFEEDAVVPVGAVVCGWTVTEEPAVAMAAAGAAADAAGAVSAVFSGFPIQCKTVWSSNRYSSAAFLLSSLAINFPLEIRRSFPRGMEVFSLTRRRSSVGVTSLGMVKGMRGAAGVAVTVKFTVIVSDMVACAVKCSVANDFK